MAPEALGGSKLGYGMNRLMVTLGDKTLEALAGDNTHVRRCARAGSRVLPTSVLCPRGPDTLGFCSEAADEGHCLALPIFMLWVGGRLWS